MDYIVNATKPGNYKTRKPHPKGRTCECGARLSVYNADTLCSVCTVKKFNNLYGGTA